MAYGPYPAVVTKLYDGDTFTVDLDLGFGIHETGLRCRVWKINAPELKTPEGKAAEEYLAGLMPVGTKVQILSHGWDNWGGRFDGEVQLPDGSDLGTKMVESGNAVPLSG